MRLTIFALVIACGALLVPGALAGKPDRQRLPIGISEDYSPGQICPEGIAPAGVHLQLVGGNEAVTVFDDGRFLATGVHIIKVTNVADPDRSVIIDVHGNFTAVPQADGSIIGRGDGTTAFSFFPGDAGPGDTTTGRFYLFTGQNSEVIDASGTVTAFSSVGSGEDICAMIAS
jgi:hypothetical protein